MEMEGESNQLKKQVDQLQSSVTTYFLNERLAKFEAELKAEANRQGFVTLTKNCSVSVLVKRNNSDTGYHKHQ